MRHIPFDRTLYDLAVDSRQKGKKKLDLVSPVLLRVYSIVGEGVDTPFSLSVEGEVKSLPDAGGREIAAAMAEGVHSLSSPRQMFGIK
jgi:hypothetical protein